ncbi:hypothetical protein QCA50_005632 [Cerrena zonata]|uniref:Uncharacterized protein n=1 Tax=Cerrena zonata TaxID=2478898 RepID=A0AAW0GLM7_9APHY
MRAFRHLSIEPPVKRADHVSLLSIKKGTTYRALCMTPPSLAHHLPSIQPVFECIVPAKTQDPPLPDQTIVLMFAKACIPANGGPALFEAVNFYPVPGDPSSDDYQDSLPDLIVPLALGTALVKTTAVPLPVSNTSSHPHRVFDLDTSQYLMDSIHTTYLQALLDDTPRWRAINSPPVNSVVHFVGTCEEMIDNSRLRLRLKDLTFTPVAPPPINSFNPGTPSTPSNKRRKLQALPITDGRASNPSVSSSSIIPAVNVSSVSSESSSATAPSVGATGDADGTSVPDAIGSTDSSVHTVTGKGRGKRPAKS